MKEKQNMLIAYATNFVSFLIEKNLALERAILFGSVVTGEFDKESDIDIFLETKEKEDNIQKLLLQFEKTQGENWKLKGIENLLSLKTGNLKKWPHLKRSIQSNSILLYGPYKEVPEKIKSYSLLILNFNALKRSQKINIWRKLYGYKQKVKNKKYMTPGLVTQINGKKLERSVIAIPSNKSKECKDFLHKHKIKYKLIEIWTDSIES